MPVLTCDDALLEKALKELRVAWDATGEGWRDQARADFANDHLDPLMARARQAAGTIRRMDAILRDAVQQCT
jgi:hypothetical protein